MEIEKFCRSLKGKDIIIFGYAELGKLLYEYLFDKKIGSNISFCDNMSSKLKSDEKITVYSVKDARDKYKLGNSVFITASLYHSKAMREQLEKLGVLKDDILNIPDSLFASLSKILENQKLISKRKLDFEVNITRACNLNCKGCSHFSPISETGVLDLLELEKDYKRLNKLFGENIGRIYILGGEPLLVPNIDQYMEITRKWFSKANIGIVTNGILLNKMSEKFWNCCRDLDIAIQPTKYPIKVDYDACKKLAINHNVKYEFFGTSEIGRTLWHMPFDLSAKQDPVWNFKNCYNANNCITLEHGRLYTCCVVATADSFNKYFNKELIIGAGDYIDIYKANSAQEVLDFLSKPIPFCRYCDIKNRTYDHEWTTSKKSIKEWTL